MSTRNSRISPFYNDNDVVKFARQFLRRKVGGFRKDIAICLTQDKKKRHAYFPTLITCIAMFELLSGLFAGNIDNAGLKGIKNYAEEFLDRSKYTDLDLSILYVVFRHKIAHLTHPYFVFDTKKRKDIPGPRRRITWGVYVANRRSPIEIVPCHPDSHLMKTPTPWKVKYDHRVKISIHRLKVDIVDSIYGQTGYLSELYNSKTARERFVKCMKEFFPE